MSPRSTATYRAPFSKRGLRPIRPLFKNHRIPETLKSVTFKCT